MNLHGNTEAELVGEWLARGSLMHGAIANQPGWDGAELMVSQDQATFGTIFNALPYATMVTDIAGKILVVNPAAIKLFEYPLEDLIGRPIEMLCAGEADDVQPNIGMQGNADKATEPFEVRYCTRDSGTFIGETVITAVKDGQGRVRGWLGLIRELTRHKRAEALLQADVARLAKKNRYESIIRSHPETLFNVTKAHARWRSASKCRTLCS